MWLPFIRSSHQGTQSNTPKRIFAVVVPFFAALVCLPPTFFIFSRTGEAFEEAEGPGVQPGAQARFRARFRAAFRREMEGFFWLAGSRKMHFLKDP